MELGGQYNAPAVLPPGKHSVAIAQEAGWASGPVWMGAANFIPHWYLDPWLAHPVASDGYN
jgi:hypothetical protein